MGVDVAGLAPPMVDERKLYRRRIFKLGEFQIELGSALLDQGDDDIAMITLLQLRLVNK